MSEYGPMREYGRGGTNRKYRTIQKKDTRRYFEYSQFNSHYYTFSAVDLYRKHCCAGCIKTKRNKTKHVNLLESSKEQNRKAGMKTTAFLAQCNVRSHSQ